MIQSNEYPSEDLEKNCAYCGEECSGTYCSKDCQKAYQAEN